MPSNVIETLYRFRSDRAATNDVLRDNARIDDSLQDVAGSAERAENAYSGMEQSARRAAEAQQQMFEAQIKVARQQSEVYGDISSRVSSFAGLASGLGGGATGQRLMIASDILDATEAAKRMQAEFPKLITQMGGFTNSMLLLGAAGGALALGYLALQKFNEEEKRFKARMEESKTALSNYIDKQREFFNLVTGATPEELTQQEQALANSREAAKASLADIQANIDVLQPVYESLQPFLAENKRLGIDQQRALEITNEVMKEMGVSITLSNGQVISSAEDLVNAWTLLNQAQVDTQTEIDNTTAQIEQLGVVLDDAAQNMTHQRGALKLAFSEAIYWLNQLAEDVLPSLTKSAQQSTRDAQANSSLLGRIGGTLGTSAGGPGWLSDYAARLDKGAALIASYDVQRAQSETDTAAAILEAQTKTNDRKAEIEQSAADDSVERAAKLRDDLASIITDRDDAIARLREQARKDELQREADFNREQERRTAEHQGNLRDAALRLDATAILREQQSYTAKDKQAKEDFKVETDRRRDELRDREAQERQAAQKRLDNAKKAASDQERQQRQSLDKQLAAQDSALQAEVARIEKAGRDRLTAINKAETDALGQLYGFNTTEYTVRQAHYDRLTAQLQRFTGASSVAQPTKSLGVNNKNKLYEYGGYTNGDVIQSDPGEYVLTRQTTQMLERGMGGPLTQQRIQNYTRSVGSITMPITVVDLGKYSLAQVTTMIDQRLMETFS